MDEPNGYEEQQNPIDDDTQTLGNLSGATQEDVEILLETQDDSDSGDLVSQLTAERDEYLKALQLTKADFDNFRRRTARLETEAAEKKVVGLLEKLLPSLDDLNSLVNHMIGTEDEILISKTVPPLFATLATEGLKLIDEVQVPFDPQLHQAVVHEPGEDSPVVSEIFRLGYSWKGKILRPAMVKVVG